MESKTVELIGSVVHWRKPFFHSLSHVEHRLWETFLNQQRPYLKSPLRGLSVNKLGVNPVGQILIHISSDSVLNELYQQIMIFGFAPPPSLETFFSVSNARRCGRNVMSLLGFLLPGSQSAAQGQHGLDAINEYAEIAKGGFGDCNISILPNTGTLDIYKSTQPFAKWQPLRAGTEPLQKR